MRSGPKSFPTKNGLCQVYSDRIEISRSGVPGKSFVWFHKKGFHTISIVYILLGVGFIFASGISIWIDNYFLAFFFFVCALLSVYALWTNRNLSIAPIIDRKQIEEVRFNPAVEGVSRASFEIYFKPAGRLLKRQISLPSLMHNGAAVANSAYWIMRDEGFIQ